MNNKKLIKNTNIIKFASKVSPNISLEIIPVQTEQYSIKNECYNNVEQKIQKNGGNRVYGWHIHVNVKNGIILFAEAEAHAVWQDSNSHKICVSPQSCKNIIFLEDKNKIVKYNITIPNYRCDFSKKLSLLMQLLELKDFINIEIFKVVYQYLSIKEFLLNFNQNKDLILQYDSHTLIVKNEYLITLKLLSLHIETILLKLALNKNLSEKDFKIVEKNYFNGYMKKVHNMPLFKKLTQIGDSYNSSLIWEYYIEIHKGNYVFLDKVKEQFKKEDRKYEFEAEAEDENLNLFSINNYSRKLKIDTQTLYRYNNQIKKSNVDDFVLAIK
jgi:hypothetical protein